MLISEVRKKNVTIGWAGPSLHLPSSVLTSIALFPWRRPLGRGGYGFRLRGLSPVLQDSRFEVFKNGTLRINNVEVYDGTWYRCVSSTPAGSIEAQARVQVLGEPACLGGAPFPTRQERKGEGAAGLATASPAAPIPPLSTHPLLKQKNSSSHHHPSRSSAWSLTRRPRCPAQPQAERSPLLSGNGQVGIVPA